MRAADAKFNENETKWNVKYNENESKWQVKYFEAMHRAERSRVDDLASQKQDYDKQIAETQTTQLKTTSDLVSTQLDKVTSSLSETINKTSENINTTLAGIGARIVPLEQFRYKLGGKASVSDPAMLAIAKDIAELKLAGGRTAGAGEAVTAHTIAEALELQGKHSGNNNLIAVIAAIIAAGSLLFSVFFQHQISQQIPATYALPSIYFKISSIA